MMAYRHGHKTMADNSAGSPEYRTWKNMVQRCCDPNGTSYCRYGGRGITVCRRWRSDFINFLHDMGPRPEGHQLERKDNNKGYSPSNCIWATRKAQANNRRSNTVLTLNGTALTLAQWSERIGISPSTICQRINSGWAIERVLTQPLRGSA